MRFKGVIFDLDGTLADTIEDITASMNRALQLRGFPEVAAESCREKVGWGIKRLAFLCLPEAARNEELAAEIAVEAFRFYRERPLVHTRPYPGILELIAALGQRKVKAAVLTNKSDPVAQQVIAGLFPPSSFAAVRGDREGVKRKPDPASTWELIMDLGITPRETIFVGDSEVDMATALASDCHALGVSWGYRPRTVLEQAGAQRIIDRPEELLELW
jgi:phosphoglycolate phosphatase